MRPSDGNPRSNRVTSKRVDLSAIYPLQPDQQTFLNTFVSQYTKRTGQSKAAAQSRRSHLADSGAAADFQRTWKELVYPLTITRARGARVWDLDGNEYLDFVMGQGVCLFGHNPPFLTESLKTELAGRPQMVGPQNPVSGDVAQRLCAMARVERAFFCNTGSEAVATAIRLARAVTGRSKLAMFRHSCHGNFDGVLVQGPGVEDRLHLTPSAIGISPSAAEDVLVLDYGQQASLEVLHRHAGELAAVLVEPVQSRNLAYQPKAFLETLRQLTQSRGCALIFDELMTGFRVHPAGVQGIFGVQADLVTYGNLVGGGMPLGVVAGKSAFMDAVDGGTWRFDDDSYPREDQTFTAGTFCQQALAMAAARSLLIRLQKEGPAVQAQLNRRTEGFVRDLNGFLEMRNVPLRLDHFGSIFSCNSQTDSPLSGLFNYQMVKRGIRFGLESPHFLSTAHEDADLRELGGAIKEVVEEMMVLGFLAGSNIQPVLQGDQAPQEKGSPAGGRGSGSRETEALSGHNPGSAPEEPRLRAELSQLVGELLGVTNLDLRDNFLALGGDSQFFMDLAARLENRYLVTLPIKDLFQVPTVAALAAHLEFLPLSDPDRRSVPRSGAGPRKEFVF